MWKFVSLLVVGKFFEEVLLFVSFKVGVGYVKVWDIEFRFLVFLKLGRRLSFGWKVGEMVFFGLL